MNVDKTEAMAEAAAKMKALEDQLNEARAAYREAVVESYKATGSLQIGDVVLLRGKKATITSIVPSSYCTPDVKLFVRKHRKDGSLGIHEFEAWGSLTKVES